MSIEQLRSIASEAIENEKSTTLSWENDLYGNEFIIKKYINRPNIRIPFVTEHSLIQNPLVFGFNTKGKKYFTQSYFRKQVMKAYGFRSFGEACIYKYALNVYQNKYEKVRYGKTLIFLTHSTHFHDITADEDETILTILNDLSSAEKLSPSEVSICIYWRDILNDRMLSYSGLGYKIYTVGSAYSKDFLINLADLISGHEKIVCWGVQSAVIYGLITNKSVRVFTPKSFFRMPVTTILGKRRADEEVVCNEYMEVFFGKTNYIDRSDRKVNEFLLRNGDGILLSKQKLVFLIYIECLNAFFIKIKKITNRKCKWLKLLVY